MKLDAFFWGGINAQVLDALPVTSNSVQTRNKNPSTEIPTTYNHTLASPFKGPLPDTRRKGTASLWWLYNTVLEHTVPVLILSYEFLCLAIFLLHQCSVRSKSLFHLWVFCLWHFQQLLKIYLPFNRSLNAHQQSVTYHSAINGYQNKTQSSFNMAECYRVVTGFTPWGNKGVAWRKR